MSFPESFHGRGGRKRATARVFIIANSSNAGQFIVNKKNVTDYFPDKIAVDRIYQPLHLIESSHLLSRYTVKATVKGGGKTGQCDAIRLAFAKALVMFEEKNVATDEVKNLPWRTKLRKEGVLTRDSRKVERKLYGLHKARKRAPLVKR